MGHSPWGRQEWDMTERLSPTYMRYPLESNSQGQQTEWRLPRAGERRERGAVCLAGVEFRFYKMKRALEMDGW